MLERGSNKMRVYWFSEWESVLDDALDVLPDHPQWPKDSLHYLHETSCEGLKKLALITDGDAPVALVALRSFDGKLFQPLAQTFSIPELHLIGNIESTASLLMSLRIPMTISWWRMQFAPPQQSLSVIRSYQVKHHYILDLHEDPEIYWRTTSLFKTVRRARNLCAAFELVINPPEGIEWVTTNWGKRWNFKQGDIADRIVSARYLEGLGKHFTFMLYDGDRPVAGSTIIIHRSDAVGMLTHTDESFRKYNLGNRLFDIVFHWAKETGLSRVDMGTTQDYKSCWAPRSEQQWVLFDIHPEDNSMFTQAKKYGAMIRRALHLP